MRIHDVLQVSRCGKFYALLAEVGGRIMTAVGLSRVSVREQTLLLLCTWCALLAFAGGPLAQSPEF